MTNEQKLLQLLQIAVENGWEDKQDLTNCISDGYYTLIPNTLFLFDDNHDVGVTISLNDLITNWEKDEVSFLEALCKASNLTRIDLKNGRGLITSSFDKQIVPYVREGWNLETTSERLDWLFRIFKNLIYD